MEENKKKQEEKNSPSNSLKPDYYTSIWKKTGDFLLGFLGVIILFFLCTTAINLASPLFYSAISDRVISGVILFLIVVILSLLIIFFKIGRRFIALGMMSVLLIPFFVFGSCLLLLR